MNAFATPERTDIPGTWGTIGFGTTLFQREMGQFDPYGSTIIAVVAHEFGHIWAMRKGMMDKLNEGQKTVKRSELHADFLAGYFLGSRKRAAPNISLQAAGDLFHRIGDNNIDFPGHHGKAEERVAAAEEGFKLSYVQNRDSQHAFAAGLEYIKNL
jgi:predicted metalloprotease